jgi:hypothetical protein
MDKLIAQSGLQAETAQMIKDKFAPISEQLEKWDLMAKSFVVTDVTQKDEMKQARETRLLIVNIRTSAERIRKELKEDSLKFGNTVQSIYNDIEKQCKSIESHLKLQEDFEKNLIAAKIETLRIERESKIAEYREFTIFGQNLGTFTDADFEKTFEGAKLQYENKVAKDKQAIIDAEIANNELLAKQAAEKVENEKLRLANEILLKEKQAAEKELQAKKDAEIAAEKEKQEKELQAKKDAENLAKAPIKQQLNIWVQSFELPKCSVENEKSALIQARFDSFIAWAKKEIESI